MATQNRGGKAPRTAGSARSSSPRGNGSAGSGGTRSGPASEPGAAPRRLGQQQSASSAPRRLGQQPANRPRSAGAQRRAQRARKSSGARFGWISVGLVVVVVAVFVIVKVTSNSSTGNTAADRHPAAAPAALVNQLISTPLPTQSAQGVGSQTSSPYLEVKNPKALTSTVTVGGAKKTVPRVVFIGAEFCPYCAVERYALILALSRLGTFHNLRITQSGSSDGNIPTWSFLGSSYTSKYVAFTPYETEDRLRNALQNPPAAINSLYEAQYYAATGTIGWPYLNFGGKYILVNFPSGLDTTEQNLAGASGHGSGVTRAQIVAAIAHPNSTFASPSITNSPAILSDANFIDAAICSIDGGAPANVCQASGVKAAAAVNAKLTPTKLPTK